MQNDLRYSTRSVLPADSDIRRVRQQIRDIDSQPVNEGVWEFDYLTEFIEAWEVMKSASERLEMRIQVAVIVANLNPEYGAMSVRQFIMSAYNRGLSWDGIAQDLSSESAAYDDELRAAAKEYVFARAMMEGWRNAFLVSRHSLRKKRIKLVQEAALTLGTRGKRKWRPSRSFEKRSREAERSAELDGRRSARTIHAKARHKIDDIFGRPKIYDTEVPFAE